MQMKEIKAYIKPHKLTDVALALHEVEGLTGMTVVDVRGFGKGKAKNKPEVIMDDLVGYLRYIKIEIVCRADLAERIVSTIERSAHTGLKGDGKIYISNVATAVRISTGERGEAAV